MVMSLACGAALILRELDRRPPAAGGRLAAWLGRDGARNLLLGLLVVIALAGLLLSFSRAGIVLGLLAVAVTAHFAAPRRSRTMRAWALAALVLGALGPIAVLGASKLVDRYRDTASDLLGAGGRFVVWGDSMAMIRDFPIAGSGFGSFAATYPIYRSPVIRKFYAHAHNDPIQAFVEGGLVGLLLLALVFVPLTLVLLRAIRGAKGRLAVGFAAGLAAMLLHGLVDFNFHIPSNAATASVLAGVVLGASVETRLRPVPQWTPSAPAGRNATLVGAALVFALAGLASWLGADVARHPVEAREIGEETMRAALEAGSADPAVRERLVGLREVLGRRPLDSMTRAVYSSLLLTMSRSAEDVDAAVYQARRAAELAPVTLPVVRSSVLVLAHTGNGGEAAELVRQVFTYDPESAARWLERIEPLLPNPEAAIPEDPRAWVAWSVKLDLSGRHEEALDRVERGWERWPDHLPLLERATLLAAGAGALGPPRRAAASGQGDPPDPRGGGHLRAARAAPRAEHRNVGLVVGATRPNELAAVRRRAPDLWILAPGVGAQGGSLEDALAAGLREDGMGLLVTVSRGISRAADPGEAAATLVERMRERADVPKRRGGFDLRSSVARGLLDAGCVKFGSFTLKSGLVSPIYIDLRRLVGSPTLLADVARLLADKARDLSYDLIAPLPYAAMPIGTAMSLQLSRPMVYPRREAKQYGTKATVEGVFVPGQSALVVDDLATTGGSKVEGIDKLRSVGLNVNDVLVLIDRESGAAEVMAEAGVGMHAVYTLSELLEIWKIIGAVNRAQAAEVHAFITRTKPV